jgi:hypothetical protein
MSKKKTYPSKKQVPLLGKVVKVGEELKMKLNAPQLLQHFLRMHTKEGDIISLVVTAKRPKRSQAQNNFFFVYLDLISLSCGHTVEELHRWVKDCILGNGITEVFGYQVRMVGETSNLNISEFCEMMNRVHEATDIPIPDPGPFLLPMTLDEYGELKIKQSIEYSKMKNRLTGANIA